MSGSSAARNANVFNKRNPPPTTERSAMKKGRTILPRALSFSTMRPSPTLPAIAPLLLALLPPPPGCTRGYADPAKLGTISTALIERESAHFTIVNAYTQFHYRGEG